MSDYEYIIERELQPEIEAARRKLAEHRLECKAPKRIGPWGPVAPPIHHVFQPFDCVLCDLLFSAIVDLMSVSRITAIAGPNLRGMAIEHIDGDRYNNSPANLRVVTIKENL